MCYFIYVVNRDGCCVDTLYFVVTIGTVSNAGGGPHNIEVQIGSTVISELILMGARDETKLLQVDLDALTGCIEQDDISSVFFTADSDNGIFIDNVAILDRRLTQIDLNHWVDGDNLESRRKVKVYEYS